MTWQFPGAPPQQVQQIRLLLLPLRDLQSLHRHLPDIRGQQVPALSVLWVRSACVQVVLPAPRGESHDRPPQPHVRGLPPTGRLWLHQVRSRRGAGEEECSLCAGSQHDQRQDLPRCLVLVPHPSHHRHLQAALQDRHPVIMEFQVKVVSVDGETCIFFRYHLIKWKIRRYFKKEENDEHIIQYFRTCSIGDWLVLYQMSRNMNKRSLSDCLTHISLLVRSSSFFLDFMPTFWVFWAEHWAPTRSRIQIISSIKIVW